MNYVIAKCIAVEIYGCVRSRFLKQTAIVKKQSKYCMRKITISFFISENSSGRQTLSKSVKICGYEKSTLCHFKNKVNLAAEPVLSREHL